MTTAVSLSIGYFCKKLGMKYPKMMVKKSLGFETVSASKRHSAQWFCLLFALQEEDCSYMQLPTVHRRDLMTRKGTCRKRRAWGKLLGTRVIHHDRDHHNVSIFNTAHVREVLRKKYGEDGAVGYEMCPGDQQFGYHSPKELILLIFFPEFCDAEMYIKKLEKHVPKVSL